MGQQAAAKPHSHNCVQAREKRKATAMSSEIVFASDAR